MPERISRTEFVETFGPALKPGDHVSLIGPTGRGKSTLWGQVIPHCSRFDRVVIMAPKGRDPAYAGLGHPTRTWPPRIGLEEKIRLLLGAPDHRQERQKIWRVEVPVRRAEDMDTLTAVYRQVLAMTYTRTERERDSVMLVVDDSKFVCRDRLMLKAVVDCLMVGRSKKITIVNNFQRPGLGVPREGLDQITHAIIAKNRDRDTAKRLAEISGTVDPKELEAAFAQLGFYEAIWVDGRNDRWMVIGQR